MISVLATWNERTAVKEDTEKQRLIPPFQINPKRSTLTGIRICRRVFDFLASLRLPLNHSNSNCQDGHAQNSYFHHHRIAVHAIKHVLRLPLENHVEVVGKFRPRMEDARIIYSSSPVHPKQSTYSSIQTTLLSFTLIVRITLFAKTPLPSYTVSHVVCRFISVSSNDLHATLRTLPTS